ncbi:MAG: PASTA domain-containing protein [Ruminococcaceae bacterium]|nr:PASTA domain-containing protein [Oscillospiraceae bacterium]
MKDIDNLCLNCFKELTEGAVCAECGYDNDTPSDTMYLAKKTMLANKYAVGAFQKHESDAVTYSGYDTQLDKKIIIREFYPKGMCSRLEGSNDIHVRQKFTSTVEKYKKSFYKLWTTLEKLHSLSAVVPVYDVFEENDTVYAIIEHLECITLREFLLRNENGYIHWDNARLMFMPILTTLENLHSNGIIHGSLTPDNLVLCRDGKVRLSPFTIQEACDITSELEFNFCDGYTAIEQYENSHKMCPATDIYSFSACIYRALSGTNPPDAKSREANDKLMIPNSIAETIPMHVIKTIGNGMQIYPEKRIKSISEYREHLDAAPAVIAKAAKTETEAEYIEEDVYPDYNKSNVKSRVIIIILVVLIIGAIAAGVYVVLKDRVNAPEETTSTTQSVNYEVPDFVSNGYTQVDVENNGAWNERFTISFEYEYSTDVEEGIIFKQSVSAGESIPSGSDIILTVSRGIQTQTIPDVANMTVEEATKTLEALGFKVSSVEVYNDGAHTPKTVRSTSSSAPAAGENAAVGEEVILQVYGEVQTTEATTENNN